MISFDESLRNTPTHVGKTSREAVRLADEGKHPHARGEDDTAL